MAKITVIPTDFVIYNVDHSVGRLGRNRRSDVLLVQTLLNALIRNILWTNKAHSKDPLPNPLSVSGICDKKTTVAILWFQKGYARLARDATMNSVEGSGTYGPRDTDYTLVTLNSELMTRRAMPSKSVIVIEPLASELRKFSGDPADNF